MLPTLWLEESVRVQRQIAQVADRRSSGDDRLHRLLDDAFAQLHLLCRPFADFGSRVAQLIDDEYHLNWDLWLGRNIIRTRRPAVAIDATKRLKEELRQFDTSINNFSQSLEVQELFQTASPQRPTSNRHSSCCPPSPFPACQLHYPEGGFLRLCWLAFQCSAHFHLYSWAARQDSGNAFASSDDTNTRHYAVEICKNVCRRRRSPRRYSCLLSTL